MKALLVQTIADQMEIIVIDNHSENDSIGIIRTYFDQDLRVRIVETPENLGYGKGNNKGARYARGKYLLIINPDNTMPPNGMETMMSYMEEHNDIGILAPQLVHDDGSIRESFRAFPSPLDVIAKRTPLGTLIPHMLHRYLQRNRAMTKPEPMDWVVGACLLMQRDFFEELEGFDERFFIFFEDTDLCRRCWKAGKAVMSFPEVKVLDRKTRLSEGGIWALFAKKTGREHMKSAVRYFAKWGIGTKSPRFS